MSTGVRVLVAGMIARVPGQGGATWAVLQYLLGLRRLGCDVRFVEDVGAGAVPGGLASSPQVRYCAGVMSAFDLDGRWTVVSGNDEVGTPLRTLDAWARDADVFIDLSGVGARIPAAMRIPVRVYVDLDPAFTQAWHVQGADVGLDGHTHHVTVGTGLAAGTADGVPDCDVRWRAISPPVVLERWPASADIATDQPFSTVGNWRSYGTATLGETVLGQRAHSFRELLDLPRRTACRFRVALSIHPGDDADRCRLDRGGWEVVDPASVAATPDTYAAFVRGSLAEIGVAKHGYVATRSGWLSDRTACYLASGRPVVAQDTGVAGAVPTGDGLLTFTDLDSAAAAVESVHRDYDRHARRAREIAVEHLDSDRVLAALLDHAGTAA
jgi:hypothetical protein